jgi:hypothetical protein
MGKAAGLGTKKTQAKEIFRGSPLVLVGRDRGVRPDHQLGFCLPRLFVCHLNRRVQVHVLAYRKPKRVRRWQLEPKPPNVV